MIGMSQNKCCGGKGYDMLNLMAWSREQVVDPKRGQQRDRAASKYLWTAPWCALRRDRCFSFGY